MKDNEFLSAFENCTLPKTYFNHRNHLRLAWLYLSQSSLQEALPRISASIRRYAASINASAIYHETLTCLWVYLVYQAMPAKPSNFSHFINTNAYLLDKKLPEQYYSPTLLNSPLARAQWVNPDLKSLGFLGENISDHCLSDTWQVF